MKASPAQMAETRAKILAAIVEMYEETGDVPSTLKVAERCGLNRDTVAKYRREISVKEFFPTLQTKTLEILNGLAKRAMTGDAAAVKVWLQFVEQWKEEIRNTNTNAVSPEVWKELERLKGML